MIECSLSNTFVVEDKLVNGVLKTVRVRDEKTNQLIPTNTIKMSTSLDTDFPPILSAKRIAKASKELTNLKFVPNTDYRKASEPTVYEETQQHSCLYKPLPKTVRI